MSIELVILSNHLILCFLLLPSIFPSLRVYSSESALCIMWPKYWSFRLVSCIFCSVQFSHSVVSDSFLPHDCTMPGLPVHHQLPEHVQTHVHWVGDPIQPSHPLSSPSPPAFNLSQHQGIFQWVSSWNQVPKYWRFSFSINPSNEYSGLISFRTDWFDLLAV